MPHRRLPACLLTSLAAIPVLAQSKPADSLPLLDPVCRILPPVKVPIEGAAFSPDRQIVYVQVSSQAINVTEIVASFWIEILGALGLILLLVTVITLWRIRRRPRMPGEPHCRRCNYCLKSCPSDCCPECGHHNRRPVIGRSTLRRLLPCLIALAIYATVSSTAVVIGYPIGIWAAERAPLWSTSLASTAASVGINLSRWNRPVEQVLAYDATTGSLLRVLHTSGAVPSVTDPAPIVSPDGRLLLTVLDATHELLAIDTQSGAVRARAPAGNREPFTSSRWQDVLGFLPDGSIIACVIDQFVGTRIVHWSYTTEPVDLYVDEDMGWLVILLPGPKIRILDAQPVSTAKRESWLGIHSSHHGPFDSTRLTLIEFPDGVGRPAKRTELPVLKGRLIGSSNDCRRLYVLESDTVLVYRLDDKWNVISNEAISTNADLWPWQLSDRLIAVDSIDFRCNGPLLNVESEKFVARLRVSVVGAVDTTPEPARVPATLTSHRFGVIADDPALGDCVLIFDVPLPPAD